MFRVGAFGVLLAFGAMAVGAPVPGRFTAPLGNVTANLEIDDGGKTLAFGVVPANATVDLESEAAAFGTLLDQRLAFGRPTKFYLSVNGNAAIARALSRSLAADRAWDSRRGRPRTSVPIRTYLLGKLAAGSVMQPLYASFLTRGYRLVPVTAAKVFVANGTISIGELGFDASAAPSGN